VDEMKKKWTALTDQERQAAVVALVIIGAIILIVGGIQIGGALFSILN
jgi:hypothetical protein